MSTEFEDETAAELLEWAATMDGTPAVRVEIYRVSPTTWRGRQVAGRLGDYDELPSFEDIRDDHGGGKFRLIVKRPDERGRLTYRLCRTLKIAGSPLLPPDAPLAFDAGERDRAVLEIVDQALNPLRLRLSRLEELVRDLLGQETAWD
jgi:hypothetical protein